MKIHTTIGLYPNGEKKYNGVAHEDLATHIEYNKAWRWGRALIVDGELVYKGNVDQELIDQCISDFKAKPITFNKPTIPYR